MPDVRSTLTLSANGALTIGTAKDRWIAPFAGDVVNVTAVVGVAPTGLPLIFDIKKETGAPGTGTSLFTTPANRPTVPIGAFESPVSYAQAIGTDPFAPGVTSQGPRADPALHPGPTNVTPPPTATSKIGVPNVTSFAAGDVLVLDVIQVGNVVAGSDADVVVQFNVV